MNLQAWRSTVLPVEIQGLVSVVVLTVDRLDVLRRCVESVHQHTRRPFEWIFVLNGASLAIRTYLEDMEKQRFCSGVARIVLESNEGVTPGRNAGVLAARGEYVLFLDDDAWVTEATEHLHPDDRALDWLGRLTQWFADPAVGIVSQSGSYINPQTPGVFWECKTRGADCDVGQGYCFMFRRALIERIGLLDPAFGRFWHEESEFALRAKAAGSRVLHAGYVGVTHYGAGSGDDGTYGQKISYMFDKHRAHFPTILVPRDQWR